MFCILPARDGEEEEYSSGQVLEYVHQTAQYSIFHMWVVQLVWDLRWIVSLTNWEIWQCVHIHNPTIATIIVICSYPGCWLQGTTVTTNFIFCFLFKDKRSFAVGALYSFYKATATHIKVENWNIAGNIERYSLLDAQHTSYCQVVRQHWSQFATYHFNCVCNNKVTDQSAKYCNDNIQIVSLLANAYQLADSPQVQLDCRQIFVSASDWGYKH